MLRLLPEIPNCGATVSLALMGGTLTVTVNTLEAMLPAASDALTMTFVVPIGNKDPDVGLLIVATVPLTISTADVANVTNAPLALVAFNDIAAGAVIDGGVVSTTTTDRTAVPVRPRLSVATH